MLTKIALISIMSLSFTLVSAQDAPSKDSKPAKITAEEIVFRHLASIGSTEDLSAMTSLVLVGNGTITAKLGSTVRLGGTAQIASSGKNFLIAMAFESPTYPFEKVAYDGDEMTLGLINGNRTVLGDYLKSQSSIIKEGLLGGVFSVSWPLRSKQTNSKVKFDFDGTSKIGDRECYKLKFSSSKMGSMKVNLYFDVETFRHIRSEYLYTIEPRIGTSPTDVRSSSRIERYRLTENFGDFKAAGKFVLPTIYNINVTTERQIATDAISRDWTLTIDQVYFNETIGTELFKVS